MAEKQTRSVLGVWFNRLEDAFALIASILVISLTVLIGVSVISRYVFDAPLGWVQELTEYTLLFITFLAAPRLLREDGHVRVDIVLSQLGPRNKALLRAWGSLLSALACFALMWFSAQATFDNYQRNVIVINILQIPKFYILAIIPVSSLLLCIEFCRHISKDITEYKRADEGKRKLDEVPSLNPYSL